MTVKLEQLSKPGKSLSLKNKWTSMSKKGVENGGKMERKSGLTGILAAHRAKSPSQRQSALDIVGVIAAAKKAASEQVSDELNNSMRKRKQSAQDNLSQRVTKLPSIVNH